MELTVSQIAKRIASDLEPADVARVTRQIRHWTMAGVIPTTGPIHAGPGRHRRYSGDALYVAAILVELVRFGIPIGVMQKITGGFRSLPYDKKNFPGLYRLWHEAVQGTRVIHAAFTLADTSPLTKRVSSGKRFSTMTLYAPDGKPRSIDDVSSMIVVNLTKLFSRLRD